MSESKSKNGVSTDRSQKEKWEHLTRTGNNQELKYGRDLPDDTPEQILKYYDEFEDHVTELSFEGVSGLLLDAGCGNGNLVGRAIESGFTKSINYVGLDFSENMLSRARRRVNNLDFANFIVGSVSSLSFKNGSFDRIVCSGVTSQLLTVERLQSSLAEFNRILKPAGILLVDFFNRSCPIVFAGRIFLREKIDPPRYISPSVFRAMLEIEGFTIEREFGFGFKQRLSGERNKWQHFTDPWFLQEKFSRFMENHAVNWFPMLGRLGYRIYVKCRKNTTDIVR